MAPLAPPPPVMCRSDGGSRRSSLVPVASELGASGRRELLKRIELLEKQNNAMIRQQDKILQNVKSPQASVRSLSRRARSHGPNTARTKRASSRDASRNLGLPSDSLVVSVPLPSGETSHCRATDSSAAFHTRNLCAAEAGRLPLEDAFNVPCSLKDVSRQPSGSAPSSCSLLPMPDPCSNVARQFSALDSVSSGRTLNLSVGKNVRQSSAQDIDVNTWQTLEERVIQPLCQVQNSWQEQMRSFLAGMEGEQHHMRQQYQQQLLEMESEGVRQQRAYEDRILHLESLLYKQTLNLEQELKEQLEEVDRKAEDLGAVEERIRSDAMRVQQARVVADARLSELAGLGAREVDQATSLRHLTVQDERAVKDPFPQHLPQPYDAAVRFVVNHGWDALHGGDPGPAWTALHWAALEGRPDVVKLLLNCRANPSHRDEKGKSPLEYAIEAEQCTVAMMLRQSLRPRQPLLEGFRVGSLDSEALDGGRGHEVLNVGTTRVAFHDLLEDSCSASRVPNESSSLVQYS